MGWSKRVVPDPILKKNTFKKQRFVTTVYFENPLQPRISLGKNGVTAAGVPLELLQQDYWVPGVASRQECAKYHGKTVFREIFQSSGPTCLLWITRMIQEQLHQLNMTIHIMVT